MSTFIQILLLLSVISFLLFIIWLVVFKLMSFLFEKSFSFLEKLLDKILNIFKL